MDFRIKRTRLYGSLDVFHIACVHFVHTGRWERTWREQSQMALDKYFDGDGNNNNTTKRTYMSRE